MLISLKLLIKFAPLIYLCSDSYRKQSDFPDEIPEVIMGDGDGTVPARSLKVKY